MLSQRKQKMENKIVMWFFALTLIGEALLAFAVVMLRG